MEKLNVLVSLITDDNDYQLEQAASAQVAASKLGIHIQILYAANDAVQQTQQILNFVQDSSKRPDAIVVEPVGTGMPQVARAAVQAGIGWVALNCEVDYVSELRRHSMVPVFSMCSDNVLVGKIQGQQIAAFLGDKGCVLSIEGPMRDVARLRANGMMAAKPAAVSVKTLRGDWTQGSGYHAVKSWLALSTSRQLNVGMIVCQNDDMAVGARRALDEIPDLQERDYWRRMPITGCDGLPRSGQSWVRQGRMAATVVCPPLVGDALQMLTNALKTGSQPPERTVATPVSFPDLKELQKARAQVASAHS